MFYTDYFSLSTHYNVSQKDVLKRSARHKAAFPQPSGAYQGEHRNWRCRNTVPFQKPADGGGGNVTRIDLLDLKATCSSCITCLSALTRTVHTIRQVKSKASISAVLRSSSLHTHLAPVFRKTCCWSFSSEF